MLHLKNAYLQIEKITVIFSRYSKNNNLHSLLKFMRVTFVSHPLQPISIIKFLINFISSLLLEKLLYHGSFNICFLNDSEALLQMLIICIFSFVKCYSIVICIFFLGLPFLSLVIWKIYLSSMNTIFVNSLSIYFNKCLFFYWINAIFSRNILMSSKFINICLLNDFYNQFQK